MKGLTPVDYAMVVAYLVAIAAFGSSFYKRRSTPRDYFLGGRSMSWIPAGISIVAADLSAISVMGSPAWSYKHNLEITWLLLCYPLTAPVVIRVFVPFYARLNLYTAYEYLERRFNLPVRLVTSALFQALRGTHVAIALYAPSLVINLATGLPVWQCVLFMGLFTTVYTTLGGMKAVIWTDVIQFFTVTLGILLIFFTAMGHTPGGFSAAWRAAAEAGRLNFLNLSTDPRELTSLWACLIGGSTLVLSTLTTDQAILQRLFTTKSADECRRSVMLQAGLNVPTSLLLYFAGIMLYAFYSFHRANLAGLTSDDAIVPFFAMRELPPGVSGLILAAIFAASMAVMSAGINSLTTAATVDFYQRVFRPNETAGHYASVGRIGSAIWGCGATALAMFADRLGELAIAYNRVNSFIAGPLLGIFLLGMLTRRATSSGALAGALAGAVAVSWMSFRTPWSFFYQSAAGVAVTVVAGYAASLCMAAPDENKIRGYVLGLGAAAGKPENASL
ncbi:MAG: sodium/solute symporter [Bryobacterales bacterium]|nr:sodium/solute symporter [Bryobacterales bacterium]